MKFKYAIATCVVAFSMGTYSFATADRPILVSVPVRNVFVPQGFDDNDNIQIVLEGVFQDTCHKLAHTEVLSTEDGKSLQILQWARKFSGICIPTSVPFTSEVNVGRLQPGTYQVSISGAPNQTLFVNQAAVNSQDERLYAPVSKVSVGRINSVHYIAKIEGRLPNNCFTLEKTEVLTQDKVLVLLPVISYEDRGSCSANQIPFEIKVALPLDLSAGKYLVHVRSMNGKSVNSVFFADGD